MVNRRGGFTLVEVVLALGLSTLVVTILAMAIHVQLRASEVGRRGVEEAQLARALLHRIAQDLRGLVRYEPADLSKLVTTTSSSSDTSSDSSDKLAPMLVGTLTRLEVDVSYVPGTDQFLEMSRYVEGSTSANRPSDMKTVAWFMAEEAGGMVDLGSQARHGLVRRDLDRSVTRWASDQGQLDQLEQGLEPIAPEVTAVEFRYYDGTEWLETWDSQEEDGFPLAVEITLMIARKQHKPGLFASLGAESSTSSEELESVIYRLIVQLPAAKQADSSESSSSQETQ